MPHPEVFTLSRKEYFNLTNPKDERHDSGSYETQDIEKYQKSMAFGFEHDKITSTKVQTFKRNGREFGVYLETKDMMDHDVYKRTEDGSEWLRDENDQLVKYGDEEKLEYLTSRGRRYLYEHHIKDESNGLIVANTQDEWGCLLYHVAAPYEGFGLGTTLLEFDQKVHPYRHSGGYTPEGERGAVRFHANQVRKAMASGKYSQMVRDGKMTAKDAIDILRSANVINWVKEIPDDQYNKYKGIYDERAKQCGMSRDASGSYVRGTFNRSRLPDVEAKFDLGIGKAKNLVMAVEDNCAILYDKTLYSIIHGEKSLPSNSETFWSEKAIMGYVYIGGVYNNDEPPRIYGLYAQNEKIEKFMMNVAANLWVGEELRVTPEQRALLRGLPEASFSERQDIDRKYMTLESPTMDLDMYKRHELLIQKQLGDKWGEKRGIIGEIAYGLAEDHKNELRFFNPKPEQLQDKLVESKSFNNKLMAAIGKNSEKIADNDVSPVGPTPSIIKPKV